MNYQAKPFNQGEKTVWTKTEVFSLDGFPTTPEEDENQFVYLEKTTSVVESEGKRTETFSMFSLEGVARKYKCTFKPVFVKPYFFDYIKGNNPFSDCISDEDGGRMYAEDRFDEIGEDWVLVWKDYSSHTLLDENLDPIPYAQRFDYCGAPFSSEHLILSDEFLSFLKNHPWVVNKDCLKIEDIPCHNAEEGRDLQVKVQICPDAKTYKEIWDYCLRSKGWGHPPSQVRGAICSNACTHSADAKDWFGIRPFLRSPILRRD